MGEKLLIIFFLKSYTVPADKQMDAFSEFSRREAALTIFETIGIAYTILATTFFTIELIYCAVKGVNNLRHLLARGQGGPERRGASEKKLLKITS